MSGTSLGATSYEILQAAMRMVPPQVSEDPRGFSLRCAVPNRLVNGLLGKDGSIAKENLPKCRTNADFLLRRSGEIHKTPVLGSGGLGGTFLCKF